MTLNERKITVGIVPGRDALTNISFNVDVKEMESIKRMDFKCATAPRRKFWVQFTALPHSGNDVFRCDIQDLDVDSDLRDEIVPEEFLEMVADRLNGWLTADWTLPRVASQLHELAEVWV